MIFFSHFTKLSKSLRSPVLLLTCKTQLQPSTESGGQPVVFPSTGNSRSVVGEDGMDFRRSLQAVAHVQKSKRPWFRVRAGVKKH